MKFVKATLKASKLALTFSNYTAETPASKQHTKVDEFPQPPRHSRLLYHSSSSVSKKASATSATLTPCARSQFPSSQDRSSASATNLSGSSITVPSQQQPPPKPSTDCSPLSSITTTQNQPEFKPLTKEHTAKVCKCLYPLRAKWRTIGTFLCVEHSTLDAIRANYEDCGDRLTELIAEWLKQLNPPPTWQSLAEAVQCISSDRADEIRRMFKYLHD